MADEETRKAAFSKAVEAIRAGQIDAIKAAMEALGFVFRQTGDPNHWVYFHPLLREDPLFRYPRNFYRPHGARRSSDRISRHDQSQAKQMIEALRGTIGSPPEISGDYQ